MYPYKLKFDILTYKQDNLTYIYITGTSFPVILAYIIAACNLFQRFFFQLKIVYLGQIGFSLLFCQFTVFRFG